MTLLEQLKSVSSDFLKLEEFPIDNAGEIVGWNCNSIDNNGKIIAGGTSEDRTLAKTIAIAETFERLLVQKYYKDLDFKKLFLLDKYKSSAGFAVGFNEKLSIENAVFEAIERYILQQWTDGIISLEKFDVILENNLAKTFFEKFDQIQFLKKRVNTKFKDLEIDFQIIVCIAFKGDGIFWGSKAHFNENKCIQHSLIEAFRNLNVFNNLNKSNIFEVSYVDDVIFHFGSGK